MTAPECQRALWSVTCIAALADGWINAPDLCPVCTQAFMAALDGIAGPLKWHENYLKRAES